jgi:hypothetical protein
MHAPATPSWADPPGLPVPEFSRVVGDASTRAVPAEGICLRTLDPTTTLPTTE